jgi:uncharacterized protein YdeI (YjbR/CyaY-like superfamily)
MGKRDARVDAFIEKSADFAKPILRHIRELVHAECPQAEEALKWRFPAYMYRGILCITPAFKHHSALIFWQKSIRKSLAAGRAKEDRDGLRKITSLSDLPKDSVLAKCIRESAKLNEGGKQRTEAKPAKRPVVIPANVLNSLKKNKKALAAFKALSPSHQREYVEWIAEAKREETREKRLAGMMKMLTEGKTRHWKYQRSSSPRSTSGGE